VLVDGVLVDGVLVGGVLVVPTPPTVLADGGVCGRPGLFRFKPGLLVPVTVFDGVPRFDSLPLPEAGGGVPSADDGCVADGCIADGCIADGVDPVDVLAGAENCEIAGLRSVGTSGRDVVTDGCVGLGRTRSPRGIPWISACPSGGRGTASTKSDVAASAAS